MDRTGSVRVVVHAPQRIRVKPGSYTGSPTGEIEITENGTYNVKPYATAKVDVPQPHGAAPDIVENGDYNIADYATVKVALPFEQKEVTPSTTEQIVTVTPDTEYQALSQVTVKPAPLDELEVPPTAEQQTLTPQAPNIGFSSVTVGAAPPPPTLITKQITANGTYSAEDDNADGYDEVTVAVPREITKLVDGTITEYVDDEVTTIIQYTFYNRQLLNVIRFNNATNIGMSAFTYCPLIHPVGNPHIFPNVLNIGTEGFARYTLVPPHDIGFYFPKLISIGSDVWRMRYAKVILKQQCELVGYEITSFIRTVYYVPQRYFNWYTTATNWSAAYSAYPNSIQTIEDNIDYLVSLGYDRNELLAED